MEAIESIQSLKMALSGLFMEPDGHFQLFHHSDRGLQYCSFEYVKLLTDNDIRISMTENGDPLENALAERLNGILKDEYLNDNQITSLVQARKVLARAVCLYNEDRPHMSIGNLYPSQVHDQKIQTKRLWKNYYKKNPTIVNQYQD
jgi:transposase InsO family protein